MRIYFDFAEANEIEARIAETRSWIVLIETCVS